MTLGAKHTRFRAVIVPDKTKYGLKRLQGTLKVLGRNAKAANIRIGDGKLFLNHWVFTFLVLCFQDRNRLCDEFHGEVVMPNTFADQAEQVQSRLVIWSFLAITVQDEERRH